jgi:dihydroorotase
VPLFLEQDTHPSIIRAGFEKGACIAAKLYSQYATNNSDEGVDLRFLDRIQPALAEMATLGMILLGHFELVFLPNGRDKFDPLDRERGAILYVEEILKRNPKLRVVFEHVTSKEAVDAIVRWKARGYRVEATVAPQYLLWVHQTLFEGGINPGMYAIPILKHPKDREALTNFILDHGFFGDDSAPHDIKNKAMVCGCRGGVFNAPVSLSIYFKVFKESGLDDWFKRFVKFVSVRGPEFYGLPVSERQLAMVEEPWQVPEYYELGETKIWPMLAGQTVDWRPRLLEHVAV